MVVGWGSRARASLIVPIIADVDPKQTKEEYARIGDGIANSSNPNMLYGIWPGGMGKSWKWSAEVGGHYWRTANDSEFEVINPRALAHVTPTRRQERGDRGETAGRERARPHMGDKEVRERARARKWRKCARVLEQCERQREREREHCMKISLFGQLLVLFLLSRQPQLVGSSRLGRAGIRSQKCLGQ